MSYLPLFVDILVTPRSWVVDPVLQCALGMREALRTTPEPHAFADVIPPFFAPLTCLARLADFECHLVSNAEVLDV